MPPKARRWWSARTASSRTRRIRTPRGCSRAIASAPECQQLIIDVGGLRSVHPQTKEKPGRKPFKDIKTLKEDAAGVEKHGEEIKTRYTKLFKV